MRVERNVTRWMRPLVPSISTFPSSLPSSYSIDALRTWYTSPATDPLHPAIAFSLVTSAVVFILGELTGALLLPLLPF